MATPPKFIKYIVRPEAELLDIPDDFIRRYSGNLPRFVNFMAPTGSLWKIEVVKANAGQMFFGGGWETFRHYYSIDSGYFLVFDYCTKYNHFDVLIFQKGGAESKYRVDGQAGTSTNVSSSHRFITVEPPKFCLVMCDFEKESLIIPREFTKRVRPDLPGTVLLKVPRSSFTWKVELIRELDGHIWMKNGQCKEFLDFFNIDVGHSLVFEYDSEASCFQVLIFDMTTAEIEYALAGVEDGPEREDSGSECEDSGPERVREESVDDNPSDEKSEMNIDTSCQFTKILKYHHAYQLRLAKDFTVGTGIRKGMTITVQNGEGRNWQIGITMGTAQAYYLCSGWHKFLIENEVTVKSTMSFKWVSSRIIEARVVDRGSDELFKYVRKKRIGGHEFKADLEMRDREKNRRNI